MKKFLISKLRTIASNKQGSEVVEKIFMVVVSVAIGVVATTFIARAVNDKIANANTTIGVNSSAPTVDEGINGTINNG